MKDTALSGMVFVFQVDGFLYQDLEIAVTHKNYVKYFCMGSMLLLYDMQHTIFDESIIPYLFSSNIWQAGENCHIQVKSVHP